MPSIDASMAAQYFEEMEAICREDDHRLWGLSLCGPTLFVDPETRQIVTNRAGIGTDWQRVGKLWMGSLPEELPVANTSLAFVGLEWTMVMWPLPEDSARRAELLMHESWHRIQNALGLPFSGSSNAHLDELEGRYWLLLEMRALAVALVAEGEDRKNAVADAVAFRGARRTLFADAAEQERALENHEGLAAYTGSRLAYQAGAEIALARGLAESQEEPSLVRSFAYATGPAYGLLLDTADPDWKRRLRAEADLSAFLITALGVDPAVVELQPAAARYGGADLRRAEEERAAERERLIADLRKRLVEGPVIRLPIVAGQFQFDPRSVTPLPGHGAVYQGLRISDSWGILTVHSGGALMAEDWSGVTVPAPTDAASTGTLEGAGWSLSLEAGWRLAPGSRPGDFTLLEDALP